MSDNFIGVDLGGTKLSVARWRDGQAEEPAVSPVDHGDPKRLVQEIVDAIRAQRNDDTAAVGVGAPSQIDFEAGVIKDTVNLPLRGDFPLRDVLSEAVELPVYLDNDANIAALAEAYDGTKLVVRDLLMLTIGTGVGGGLILGGRVYRGTTGTAGEVGHMLVSVDLQDGAPESGQFPQQGSLEQLAAGSALDGMAAKAASDFPQSMLGRLARGGPVSGVDAVDAAQAGDGVATHLLHVLGERLGIGIANLINIFDPEVVVVGGGVSRAANLLIDPAREVAERFTLPGAGNQTTIRVARHGPKAGVLGGAILAMVEHHAG
jgi:glucokinase